MDGDLLCDFRLRSGVAESPDYIDPPRQNQSLSDLGMQFYERFNAKVPRFVADRVNPYRQGIENAVNQVCAGAGPRARRVDAEAFYRSFAAGNLDIKNRYFGEDTLSLFDSDFTSYDAVDDGEIPRDQILDFATHLWLERSREVVELCFENALLRFQVAARGNPDRQLPVLPEPPLERTFPLHLLLKYLGALLYCQNFQAAAKISRRLIVVESRPVLVLVHAFSLLALGDDTAYSCFLTDQAISPKLVQSVLNLQVAEVATSERHAWMDFFRHGDATQSMLYQRCLYWLEDTSGVAC